MKTELVEKKDLHLYYNLVSGDMYYVMQDEVKNLDKYQIPLLKKPNSSCRHCYGRGYEGKDTKVNLYRPCRCMQRCIDFSVAKDSIEAEKIILK